MRMFLLIRHKIKDWERFKKAFEEMDQKRRQYGLQAGSLLRNAKDPSEVFIMVQYQDRNKAMELLSSGHAHHVMETAGILDTEVIFLNEAVELPEPATGQVEI